MTGDARIRRESRELKQRAPNDETRTLAVPGAWRVRCSAVCARVDGSPFTAVKASKRMKMHTREAEMSTVATRTVLR